MIRFLADLLQVIAFRTPALHSQADRRSLIAGIVCFSLGFAAFIAVRNTVYAGLLELGEEQRGFWSTFLRLNLIQAVVFVCLLYIPALALLSKAMSGKERWVSMTIEEYRRHGSALLPLWGALFFIAAPVQYLVPQFLVFGIFAVSAAMSALLTMLSAYTVWAVKQLNCLSWMQALGAFCLSWFTFPIYYLIT